MADVRFCPDHPHASHYNGGCGAIGCSWRYHAPKFDPVGYLKFLRLHRDPEAFRGHYRDAESLVADGDKPMPWNMAAPPGGLPMQWYLDQLGDA